MNTTFSIPSDGRYEDGLWAVYPNSLLFESGVYEDKEFSLSSEELLTAAQTFTGATGNIEHTDFLAGRACDVRRVWVDADGTTLRGEIAVPLGLDNLLTPAEKRLSCEWDRDTKTLSGIGLVMNPRVPQAALMSAYADFAKHNTPQGQRAVQDLHDHAASLGAVCDKNNTEQIAGFASKHESTAIQQVHDTAVEHGATCTSMTGTRPLGDMVRDTVLDMVRGAPVLRAPVLRAPFGSELQSCSSGNTYYNQTSEKEKSMTLLDKIKALFTAEGLPLEETTGQIAEIEKAPLTEDPRVAAMSAQIAALTTANIAKDAAAFAAEQIAACRALPAETPALIAAFTQAARDDAQNPAVVTFSEGKTGSRVDALKALFAARPAHLLTTEQVRDGVNRDELTVLLSRLTAPDSETEKPMDAGRRKTLMNATPLGAAVLTNKTRMENN